MYKWMENRKPFLKIFSSKTEAILFLIILIVGGILALIRFC